MGCLSDQRCSIISPCWKGPEHVFEPLYWQRSSVMSSLISNVPDADDEHPPGIMPDGIVIVNVPP